MNIGYSCGWNNPGRHLWPLNQCSDNINGMGDDNMYCLGVQWCIIYGMEHNSYNYSHPMYTGAWKSIGHIAHETPKILNIGSHKKIYFSLIGTHVQILITRCEIFPKLAYPGTPYHAYYKIGTCLLVFRIAMSVNVARRSERLCRSQNFFMKNLVHVKQPTFYMLEPNFQKVCQ